MAVAGEKRRVVVEQESKEVTWTIDCDLMNKWKQEKNKIKYSTEEFTLFDSKWQLECYPNGDTAKNIDHISLYLRCNSLSQGCSKLGINLQFIFVETNKIYNFGGFFVKGTHWGYGKTIKRNPNLNKLTIKVKIAVTTTMNNGWMIWRINGYLLEEFKSCKIKDSYTGPKMDVSGISWYLCCYPNGWYKQGLVDIIIAFKNVTRTLDVSYCIKCENADYEKITHVNINENKQLVLKSIFSHDIFKKSNDTIMMFKICATSTKSITGNSMLWGIWGNDLSSQIESESFGIDNIKWRMRTDEHAIKLKLSECLSKEFPIKAVQKIECKELKLCEKRVIVINNDKKNENEFCCEYDKVYLDKIKNKFIFIECTVQLWPMSYQPIEISKQNNEKILFDPVIIDTNKNEKKIDSEGNNDNILYNKHREIIRKWNENSSKLESASQLNDKSLIESNGKNKQIEENILFQQVFNKYCECYSIINEQSNRLNEVPTENYLLQLITHQKSITESIKEKESKLLLERKQCDNETKEYETLQQQRIDLQNKVKKKFKKCNKIIQNENILFQQLQETKCNKDIIDKEIEALKLSSQSCVSVIKLYNEFMENNKMYIDEINTNFDKIWNEFESKWMKWNGSDIIIWFKYKTITMNTNKIYWTKTENQLKTRNITGRSLQKFNDLTFELIGIQDFEIVNHLISQIHILLKKHSTIDQNISNQGGDEHKEIPKRFLCPITKQLMSDPVIAFDGHCYDRSAIENYLKINNKSPITGAKADYSILFPINNLKNEIQQFVKKQRKRKASDEDKAPSRKKRKLQLCGDKSRKAWVWGDDDEHNIV